MKLWGRDGVRVAWVQSSWGTLLEDMLRDRFDIGIGGKTRAHALASCIQVFDTLFGSDPLWESEGFDVAWA